MISRKKTVVLCAVCGEEILDKPKSPDEKKTREHVVPKSWYPDGTNKHQRWTVPAQARCNNKFSSDEDYVGRRLATVINTEAAASKGVWERFFRGITPEAGNDERDAHHRRKAKEKMHSDIIPIEAITSEMREHGLKGLTNPSTEPTAAITMDPDRTKRVLNKIARCCYYKIHDRPVSGTADVNCQFVHHQTIATTYESTKNIVRWTALGVGVNVGYAYAEDQDRRVTIVQLLLWDAIMLQSFIEEHW